MMNNFEDLIGAAKKIRGARVVVVYPNNEETFASIREALELDLARFILVGEEETILRHLPGNGGEVPGVEMVRAPRLTDALRTSIELVRDGRGDILMKGGIDTSTLMKSVLQESAGIRTGRLLTDIFVLEFPQRQGNKFIMITDGGMTLLPDIKNKVELINNAVEVAHALENPKPRVAVLSATELLISSTLFLRSGRRV